MTTVGIIGYHASFQYPIEEVKKRLEKVGMKLIFKNKFLNRLDVVNFYKKIDLQIVWVEHTWITKNPMKLYNAASFGIPTVGHKHSIYKEFEGYYVPVTTMDEMIKEIVRFKEDKKYYKEYSNRIIPKAEEYHISNIAKLYKNLTKTDSLKYILEGYNVKDQKSPIMIHNSRGYSLTRLFKRLGFVTGAEIGVAKGLFSQALCQVIPNLKLSCIDAWQVYDGYAYASSQAKMEALFANAKQRLTPFNCQIIRNTSMEAAKQFADESLDFVYIDANHDYKHAKEDIQAWSKKVRKGGIVAGHDYISPQEILQKLPQYSAKDYNKTNYAVKQAVDDWVKEKKIKYLFVFSKDIAPSWFYVKG